jgi:hypothetical protein
MNMKHCGLVATTFTQFLITTSIADELSHVCVTSSSQDMVGERLVYNVKELIRKSRSMKLMPSEKETGCLRLIIMTMERLGTSQNIYVYSVTWVASVGGSLEDDYYIDGTLGYCGSTRVTEAAEVIVARTEKLVSSFPQRSRTPPSSERSP